MEIETLPFKPTRHAGQLGEEEQEKLRKDPLFNDAKAFIQQLMREQREDLK